MAQWSQGVLSLNFEEMNLNQRVLAGVKAAIQAGDEGIQILGGYGFVVEYHVERHYRDGMTLANLEGGTESLRMNVVS